MYIGIEIFIFCCGIFQDFLLVSHLEHSCEEIDEGRELHFVQMMRQLLIFCILLQISHKSHAEELAVECLFNEDSLQRVHINRYEVFQCDNTNVSDWNLVHLFWHQQYGGGYLFFFDLREGVQDEGIVRLEFNLNDVSDTSLLSMCLKVVESLTEFFVSVRDKSFRYLRSLNGINDILTKFMNEYTLAERGIYQQSLQILSTINRF